MVVYHVVCFFLVALLLDSSGNVAFVRIRSTTTICPLHGLVLPPGGISGKMTIPSISLLCLLSSCSLYRYVALPATCYIMPPILPCQASNPPFPANCCLAVLLLLLSPLIALLVAGEVEDFSMVDRIYVGISQYLLLYLMHLYIW